MLIEGTTDRDAFVSRLTTRNYAFWKAADDLGIVPNPIVETAKSRATFTRMMSSGGSVSLADFLPDVMLPDPDPDEDARKMNAFVESMAMRMK